MTFSAPVPRAATSRPGGVGSGTASAAALAALERENAVLRARLVGLGCHCGAVAAGSAATPSAAMTEVTPEDWVARVIVALRDDRFTVFAQPIVDLATSRVVTHELLLRMVGDDGDLVLPGEFLPIAERLGLVAEIDRWVIREGAGLAASGHAVQINISGVSLADPDLGACVERELVAVGADPALVTLEITETAIITNEALAAAFVTTVRDLGCRVALDDFGTGYGGFSYLKQFRVDSLKIDREFVTGMQRDPSDVHVVRAIVQLAHGLGLTVVAEGVEDAATLRALRDLGVDHVQGYHLARPAPALDVLTLGDAESRPCREALRSAAVA